MTVIWEEVWDLVNDSFERVAADLRMRNGRMWWTCGHADNPVFPFWATASFNRDGIAGEEDVVLSLTFKLSDGVLSFTSDIGRGEGEILSDGPVGQRPMATDTTELRVWIMDGVRQALAYFEEALPLLRRELAPV